MALWGHWTGHHGTGLGLRQDLRPGKSDPYSRGCVPGRKQGPGPTLLNEHLQATGSTSLGPTSSHPLSTTASVKPGDFPLVTDGETEALRGAATHQSLSTETGFWLCPMSCPLLISRGHSERAKGRQVEDFAPISPGSGL